MYLHVVVLLYCKHLSIEIGPASVMVGNLVSGKRIAQASGRDLGQIEDNDQARKVKQITFLIGCGAPQNGIVVVRYVQRLLDTCGQTQNWNRSFFSCHFQISQ